MDYIVQQPSHGFPHPPLAQDLPVPAHDARIPATLTVPAGAQALVLVLSDVAGSRFGAQSTFVQRALQQVGLATLLLDPLLSPGEVAAPTALTQRLVAVVDWLKQQQATSGLRFGVFLPAGAGSPPVDALAQVTDLASLVSYGALPGEEAAEEAALPTLSLAAQPLAQAVEVASDFFVEHLVERFAR